MSISTESIVVAAREQVSANLQGEAIVLGLEKGMYYGLDEVGARIWELVREPRKVAQIRDTIVAEYDVEAGTCQGDLLAFLGKLEGAGLIEVIDRQGR